MASKTTRTFIMLSKDTDDFVAFTNDFTVYDAEKASVMGSTTRVLVTSKFNDEDDSEEDEVQEAIEEYFQRYIQIAKISSKSDT